MKVLIASTVAPFVGGGAVVIVDSLERALRDRGHEVDVLKLPFDSNVTRMLPQMLGLRLHHVEDAGERLICIRTPSYLLQHPSKVLWFIHHHRGAYDLWDTEYADLPDDPAGRLLRDSIRAADDVAFGESTAIYANSRVVADRLARFNSIKAEVLFPPLDAPDQFRCGGYGADIVYVSRLHHHKRQWLAIEAMQHTRTPVRLVLAGAAGSPLELDALTSRISEFDLHEKVVLREGWMDEASKVELLSACLAVVYCPFDEDSYGYASLEAHQSRKAVITTTDSGGVLELVDNGINGFICDPTPQALARRFDELYEDRALAAQLGEAGHARLSAMNISWDHVTDRLLA